MAVFDLWSTLRQRLRCAPSASSVKSCLPVLFFGDALTARVATIGLNPSKYEYIDRHGALLNGWQQRFATTTSLGAAARDQLSDAQAGEAIDVMRAYFDDGKPVYGPYFGHLAHFLEGVGVGYHERDATHLDLVQEPTDPVWGDLSERERSDLLGRDLPFLLWQLEHLPHLKAAFCAGKTVSDRLRARVPIAVHEVQPLKRITWWVGTAQIGQRRLPIGGWNYPLHQPTGLGTAGENELGRLLGRRLL